MTKTAFVLSLPANTPATEVIAAAKARGMELSAKHIYKIRSTNRSRFSETTAAPRGTASDSDTKGFPTASALIKALPLQMPTAEVIAEGKKHGFQINRHLVYVTRGAMRRKLATGQPLVPGRPGRPRLVGSGGASESEFRRLVVELGVERARALLAQIEVRLQSVLANL